MDEAPLILDIKGNALDDGPGIRSVVFFKGCPLNCAWCQNPESKSKLPELSWDKEKCVSCRACIEFCPENAISADNRNFIDRTRCILCFRCVDQCPSGALSRVGNAMTVAEIVEKVTPYKPFFETSGGGVTLSGGEPTMHMQFLSSLLKALKQEHIHTLLETSGLFNYDRFEELILPYLDAVYMDIKIIDPTWHKRYCGVSNEHIIANLARLQAVSSKRTFTLLSRTPLIPGITDSKQQITALAGFYRDHHLTSAVLLPNNPIWIEKCARLGYPEPYDKTSPVRDFYDLAKKHDIETIFSQHGIAVTFG